VNVVDQIAPQERPPQSSLTAPPGMVWRQVRRLTLLHLLLAAIPALVLIASGMGWAHRALPANWAAALSELRFSGVASLPLASSLIALAGLAGTVAMLWARRHAAELPRVVVPRRGRLARLRWRLPEAGDPWLIGRVARRPQAALVGGCAALALIVAWVWRPLPGALLAPPDVAFVLGGAVILLGFPLLVAERIAADLPESQLPEAPGLRSLLLLPVLAWPLAGALEIASGLGITAASSIAQCLAVLIGVTAAEVMLRALGRLLLPPPAPETAHAAVASSLAGLIAASGRGRLSASLRQHVGLDFSRSWALSFVGSALVPVAVLLLLLGWAATGLMPLGLDQRGIYERLGRPVAVLHPGLHVILPWPLGNVRFVEYGRIHEIPLGLTTGPARPPASAEAPAPASADRLWEQAHPGELDFLIASTASGRQSFQEVSADLLVQWRVGLSDQDALGAAYRVVDPDTTVRAAAGRVVTRYFAARTLDSVLGAQREQMANQLRSQLQRDLDNTGAGIEIVAMVIEAIHPPAGAAEAYHAVQAAEVAANASISAEQGRALAAASASQQYATDLKTKAQGEAAETVSAATVASTSFAADEAASHTGPSFLLERYFDAVSKAFRGAPVTIVDSHIVGPDAPVLDLRPPASPNAPGAGPGME
jgi:regulator of protease activity HflC (stomatin/prohibitin superfamily)